jgi:hypothetical protein
VWIDDNHGSPGYWWRNAQSTKGVVAVALLGSPILPNDRHVLHRRGGDAGVVTEELDGKV